MDRTPTIRRAGAPDTARLADILTAAFDNDPFITWLLSATETRPRRLRRFFTTLVLSRMDVDRECYISEHGGAAVWAPPGAWRMSAGQQVRALPGLARTVGHHLPRALSSIAALEGRHPDEPAHWYLEALGVLPDRQGKGIGTRLLEPVLTRCDAERLPAYLETATERNLALYERLGFQVREEFDLGNGPHFWTMWRDRGPGG
jgi:ribosomal protein S18 acetylase RimI-like enzyme